MTRAKIDRRIRIEESREGAMSLFLMREYMRHRVALRRDRRNRAKIPQNCTNLVV